MKKFRVRLAVAFMLTIGASELAAGLFTAKLIEDSYLDSLRSALERELRVIAAATDWSPQASEEATIRHYTEKLQLLKEAAGARLTLISADGTVLGESEQSPQAMDNHLDRKEVAEASAGGVGSAIRYSETLGQNMLYVAVKLSADPAPQGYLRAAVSLRQAELAIRKLWLFLLTGLAVLIAASGIAAYRIAYGMTRPLEHMTRIAKRFTRNDFRRRTQIRRPDEIGQLAAAIDEMADSLERQMARLSENESRLSSVLEHMVSGVMMIDRDGRIMLLNRAAERMLGMSADKLLGKPYRTAVKRSELTEAVTECMNSRTFDRTELQLHYPEERQLEVTVSPLYHAADEWAGVLVVLHDITAIRKLERMRSEFVANVSHELKTPITAVKGFAETLLSGAIDDEAAARSFLKIIFDESERLNRLLGDLLELSKIESKRIPLRFSPVELRGFSEQMMNMMRKEAERKRITLELNVPEELYVEADEDRLRQILINLLSNAINYTPEGGRVRLSAEYAETGESLPEGRVRLILSDTGIGIPKQDLPRVFERFYRVDKARSRQSGGTGLGLSIVKHLVELHGGTITVASETGVGTTFTIDLPLIQETDEPK